MPARKSRKAALRVEQADYSDPWDEIEGNPPPVSQAMMREVRELSDCVSKIKRELELAEIDRDAVVAQIEELFLLGGGVEPGKWTVRKKANGELAIFREEELAAGGAVEEPPF